MQSSSHGPVDAAAVVVTADGTAVEDGGAELLMVFEELVTEFPSSGIGPDGSMITACNSPMSGYSGSPIAVTEGPADDEAVEDD